MFDKNFYPSSSVALEELFKGIECLGNKPTILEPSAGDGRILDFIKKKYQYNRLDILAVEKSPELQAILRDKEYRLIGSDFLTTPINYRVDYIFMNPPFDKGAKHLLRAWDIIHCGTIRCLLNAETYKNPYSKERKLLVDIIKENGSVRNIGKAFKNSDRTTDVEVIVVELIKVSEEKLNLDIDLEATQYQEVEDDLEDASELVRYNVLKSKEERFNAHLLAFKRLLKAQMEYDKYTTPSKYKKNIKDGVYNNRLNDHIQKLTKDSWDNLLESSKFTQFLTKRVKDEFLYKQFPHQQSTAFTHENMMGLLDLFYSNSNTIFDKCVLDCFDLLTDYYECNRVHVEGWKTNDAYKVNEKFILPNVIELSEWSGGFVFDYTSSHVLDDLDITMCRLSGIPMYVEKDGNQVINILSLRNALKESFEKYQNDIKAKKVASSTFFELKYYNKGTLHFKFKDSLLWRVFNCRASELRGYPLPDSKGVYKEQAEKANLKLL